MTDEPNYDAIEAGRRMSEMWLRLANQIADAIPDIVIGGEPVKAVRWAACADACFWQATGEGDCHNIKSLLADHE